MTTTLSARVAEQLTQAATAAVAALEALPEGAPFASEVRTAEERLAALRTHARRDVFPTSLPQASAGTMAEVAMVMQLSPGRGTEQLIPYLRELHGQALAGGNAALARAIRGPWGVAWLRLRADDVAAVLDALEPILSAQLVEAGELLPAARVLAQTVPALRAQLDSAHGALQAALDDARRRRRDADAEADRVLALATKERRRALRDRVSAVGTLRLKGDLYVHTAHVLMSEIDDASTPPERIERITRAVEAAERERDFLAARS